MGVIVTLLYLATQIRRNTRALDAASRQDVSDRLASVSRLQLDPKIARAYAVGLSDYPATSFEERSVFATILGEQATNLQSALALYESGSLPEETYLANLDWVASLYSTPGGARWWEDWGSAQPGGLARAINERLARGGLLDPREHDNYRLDDLPPAQQGDPTDSA
jgi:hypothetical protein